jgi:hypothetical protein
MSGRRLAHVVLFIASLALLLAAGADATAAGQSQPKAVRFCFDGDGTTVFPCSAPDFDALHERVDASLEDQSGASPLERHSLMKKKGGYGDSSFCILCHVNATNEVAGPRMLRDAVLADPPLFWTRHGVIASRVVNKRVLTNLRDSKTLSSTLQRLMAARPAAEPGRCG